MKDAKVAVNGVEYDVESDDWEPEAIVNVKVDGGDEDEEKQDGSGDDEGEEEEDGSDEDEDEYEDSDDDEDEEAASEEEDLGSEYLIQPVGRAEDEEEATLMKKKKKIMMTMLAELKPRPNAEGLAPMVQLVTVRTMMRGLQNDRSFAINWAYLPNPHSLKKRTRKNRHLGKSHQIVKGILLDYGFHSP
ncbi:hypothetical protein DsansV1_C04g0049521 [Dioscorea sansibarensis]